MELLFIKSRDCNKYKSFVSKENTQSAYRHTHTHTHTQTYSVAVSLSLSLSLSLLHPPTSTHTGSHTLTIDRANFFGVKFSASLTISFASQKLSKSSQILDKVRRSKNEKIKKTDENFVFYLHY